METPFGRWSSSTGCRCRTRSSASYDALDLLRGVEVFLNCMPGASMVAMRNGFRSIGVDASQHPRLHRPASDLGAASC